MKREYKTNEETLKDAKAKEKKEKEEPFFFLFGVFGNLRSEYGKRSTNRE